jgi:glycosyltransferase involved in cell wall biosynthesis
MRNNDQSPIVVSIVSLAYNHAKYIRQCLDGFIMQKTNFAFEVLIHDDASTDGTADIIREYELKYPNIIKPIYQTENQYQKGVAIGATYLYPRVQGKYIAECEGDDYWTDPLKLQRQVDFLETHSDYSMTTENATRLYLHTHKSEPFSKRPTGDIQMEELILTRQFATASVLYRMESMHLPQNIKIYDTLLWCLLAQNGKIHYQDVV